MFLYVCEQTFHKLYGRTTREFLGLRMRNSEDIIFIWIETYRKIFKSALVTFKVGLLLPSKKVGLLLPFICFNGGPGKPLKMMRNGKVTNRNSHRRCSVRKERLWHRYFPVNFAKFLRTSFLQKTPRLGNCFYTNPVEMYFLKKKYLFSFCITLIDSFN